MPDNLYTYNIAGNLDNILEIKGLHKGNAEYNKILRVNSRGEIQYHVVVADLNKFDIVITKPPRNVMSVPAFLKAYGVQVAINGDGWTSLKKGKNWYISMAGQSASRGVVYGPKEKQMAFYFDENNNASLERPKKVWNAISFPNILVENGKISDKIKRTDVDPRTGLGFTKDKKAILVTVDGKETYNLNRTGMNFTELAEILVSFGAWIGANMDGGGSTTMVVEEEFTGKPVILNVPCGENIYHLNGQTYKLRSVANHFGLRLK